MRRYTFCEAHIRTKKQLCVNIECVNRIIVNMDDRTAGMGNILIRRPNKEERAQIHALFGYTIAHTFEAEGVGDEVELIASLVKDQQELIDPDLDTDGQPCFFLVAQRKAQVVATICHRPCSDIIRVRRRRHQRNARNRVGVRVQGHRQAASRSHVPNDDGKRR